MPNFYYIKKDNGFTPLKQDKNQENIASDLGSPQGLFSLKVYYGEAG